MTWDSDKVVVFIGIGLCLGLVWIIDWQEFMQAYVDALACHINGR